MKAYISEIFSSLQGEGIYLGQPQIFVRFAGCNLRCTYCDTPESLSTEKSAVMSLEEVLEKICQLHQQKKHESVSLTGGEPLLQAAFLKHLLPHIQALGLKTYLETHGGLPEALRHVIEHVDIVAMDIKMPSSISRELWKEHEEFLKISGPKAFVKIVVTEATSDAEIEQALALVRRVHAATPVVLQPVTPIQGVVPPSEEKILAWRHSGLAQLRDVRIQGQMHPIWGVR